MTRIEVIWGRTEDVIIALLSLLALSLIIFEVVARYFVPAILPDWGAEITIYMMITAILLAGSPLVLEGRHISADLFVRRLPPGLHRVIEGLNLVVGLLYCGLVAKLGVDVVAFAQMLDTRSYSTLQFPLWIFYIAVPLGFGLMTIRYLIRLYRFTFQFDISLLPGHESAQERIERRQD